MISNTYAADKGIDISKELHLLVFPTGEQRKFETFQQLNSWCEENEYSMQDLHWEDQVAVYAAIDG